MTILNTLKSMDQKFAWSFLGFVLAVIFGGITIYLGFFKDDKPDLNYTILSNSGVLDIKEEVGNLDVLYRGNSLSQDKKDLKIITFKVINTGESSILPNFYDPKDPLGFKIENGEIAEKPLLISASNEYLEKNLEMLQNKNSIEFSNVILESNEYFEIKVLVLHSIGVSPQLQSTGKIAGIRSINVVSGDNFVDERSFFDTTFGGGVIKNITRVIVYGIVFIAMIILVALFISSINDARSKAKRKKLVKIFREFDNARITESDHYFFELYIDGNESALRYAYQRISNPNENINYGLHIYGVNKDNLLLIEQNITNTLIDKGFITKEGSTFISSQERLAVINEFIQFLRRKGEYKKTNAIFKNAIALTNEMNDALIE